MQDRSNAVQSGQMEPTLTPAQMRATLALLGWQSNGYSYFKRRHGGVGWVIVKPEYSAGLVYARTLVTLNDPALNYGIIRDCFGDKQMAAVFYKIEMEEMQRLALL